MTEGVKKDQGKARWDLVPWDCMSEVVRVLTWPVDNGKYSADNWQKVPNARRRYFAAAHRHFIEEWWINGSQTDAEDGHHPLAHAICCLLFLLWFDRNGAQDNG